MLYNEKSNSSAKVQQFFEKNNIPFVFMILYDKK